jgi:hypothetical protein
VASNPHAAARGAARRDAERPSAETFGVMGRVRL